MSIPGELLLGLFCRAPEAVPRGSDEPYEYADDPLALLRREVPGLRELVRGKRVVDFGCGQGRQALALCQDFEAIVLGVDPHIPSLDQAQQRLEQSGLPADRLRFVAAIPEAELGSFDLVISQNAMEHFPKPGSILASMKRLLRPEGRLLISFGPLWLAPRGSHMGFFCPVPWVNLLFSEETVMKVRARYRDDGARHYEEVESGLNRMTLHRFESLIAETGLEIEFKKLTAVKNLDILTRIPHIRELCTNHVTCLLRLPSSRT